MNIEEILTVNARESLWEIEDGIQFRSESLEMLSDGSDLPALRMERWNERRDAFLGWCRNIGQ